MVPGGWHEVYIHYINQWLQWKRYGYYFQFYQYIVNYQANSILEVFRTLNSWNFEDYFIVLNTCLFLFIKCYVYPLIACDRV